MIVPHNYLASNKLSRSFPSCYLYYCDHHVRNPRHRAARYAAREGYTSTYTKTSFPTFAAIFEVMATTLSQENGRNHCALEPVRVNARLLRLGLILWRVLATPAGTDRFLMTICYTTLAASTALSKLSTHQLRQTARRLIEAAISLPPDTTVLINTSALPTPRLLRLSKSLEALSSLISDFRIFVRLWGLLDIWQWGSGLLQNPPADKTLENIAWAQVAVNAAYQWLENGAYLSSKGVMGWSADKQNNAWLWSSRFWAAHVGLDLYKLLYQERKRRTRKPVGDQYGEEELNLKLQERKERVAWKRMMIVNLAYAPLTVHWSLEEGLCSDGWVGALGSIAGIAGLRELWRITA